VAVVGPSGPGRYADGRRAAAYRTPTALPIRPAEHHPPGLGRRRGPEPWTATPSSGAADAGGFALWWEAHGLLYGIPRDIEADLAAGRCAVANLSRSVLEGGAPAVSAAGAGDHGAAAVLAARLAARGGRTPGAIAARLAREAPLPGRAAGAQGGERRRGGAAVAEVVRALLEAAGEGRGP
jgi:hypothetical protein